MFAFWFRQLSKIERIHTLTRTDHNHIISMHDFRLPPRSGW